MVRNPSANAGDIYITMSSAKSDSFISAFQIWVPHISFSFLIAMAMTSSIISPLHMNC